MKWAEILGPFQFASARFAPRLEAVLFGRSRSPKNSAGAQKVAAHIHENGASDEIVEGTHLFRSQVEVAVRRACRGGTGRLRQLR